MPKQDPDIFEVLISQMWERRDISHSRQKRLAYSDIPSFSSQSAIHNRAPANSVIWTMTSINQSQTINPDCQRVPGLFY
jgi:hypothetical protein